MPTDRPAPGRLLATLAWFALATVALVQGYLILHELGHALAARSLGATVTTVDARLWSARPHAAYALDGVGQAGRAFVTAAGTLLPLLVWIAVLALAPRGLTPRWEVMRLAASAGAIAGILPWLVLPWPAAHALAPRDDTVRFTLQSGAPPALVVGVAALTLVACAAFAWWRVGGRAALTRVRGWTLASLLVGPRAPAWATLTLAGLFATAAALHGAYATVDHDTPTGVPDAPTHAAVLDLTLAGEPVDVRVAGGTGDGTATTLTLRFEDVAGGPFTLTLIDADGAEHRLASFGAGTTMGVASSRPPVTPAPGPWAIRLEAVDTVGRVQAWDAAPPAP